MDDNDDNRSFLEVSNSVVTDSHCIVVGDRNRILGDDVLVFGNENELLGRHVKVVEGHGNREGDDRATKRRRRTPPSDHKRFGAVLFPSSNEPQLPFPFPHARSSSSSSSSSSPSSSGDFMMTHFGPLRVHFDMLDMMVHFTSASSQPPPPPVAVEGSKSAAPNTTLVDKDEKRPLVCSICMDARPNAAIQPCGHASFCETCLVEMQRKSSRRTCPVCNGPMEKIWRIHL
jgi:hypothetical protein